MKKSNKTREKSSANSLKHGAYAKTIAPDLLDDFVALRDELSTILQPFGRLESDAVDDIAMARLRIEDFRKYSNRICGRKFFRHNARAMQKNLATFETVRQGLFDRNKIWACQKLRLVESYKSTPDEKELKHIGGKLSREQTFSEVALAPLYADYKRLKELIEDDPVSQQNERVAKVNATLFSAYTKALVQFNIARAMTNRGDNVVDGRPIKLVANTRANFDEIARRKDEKHENLIRRQLHEALKSDSQDQNDSDW